MQFRIAHLFLVLTCFAGVLASHRVDLTLFRQSMYLFIAVLAAWFTSGISRNRNSTRVLVFGFIGGALASVLLASAIALSWPKLIDVNAYEIMLVPIETAWTDFLKESAIFIVLGGAIGIVVAAWNLVTSDESNLKNEFRFPLRVSQIALAGAFVFRLLPAFDRTVGSRDWIPIAVLCGLVFVVHAFNWVPRMLKLRKRLATA